MTCPLCNGQLVPFNGAWVNVEIGQTSDRVIYCIACETVFKVKRRNLDREQIGELDDLASFGTQGNPGP